MSKIKNFVEHSFSTNFIDLSTVLHKANGAFALCRDDLSYFCSDLAFERRQNLCHFGCDFVVGKRAFER